MKLDRRGVASVGEKPGISGALTNPFETCACQRVADTAATLRRVDEYASEVVAAWCRIGASLRLRLEQPGSTVADDRAAALGNDEAAIGAFNVAAQRVAPFNIALLRCGDECERDALFKIVTVAVSNGVGARHSSIFAHFISPAGKNENRIGLVGFRATGAQVPMVPTTFIACGAM